MCLANSALPSDATTSAFGSVLALREAWLKPLIDQDFSTSEGRSKGADKTQAFMRRSSQSTEVMTFLLPPRSGAAPFEMESR